MKTTIYRTGRMSIGNHSEEVLRQWYEFDVRRPEGHTPRAEALFAAPDLQGALHWFSFLNWCESREVTFNEILVESDNVWVYNVEDYDEVNEHYGNPTGEQIAGIEAYWKSGMTLTQWNREVGFDEHGQWEILLSEKQVISSRTLSPSEMQDLYLEEGIDDDRVEYLKDIFPSLAFSENVLG